MWNVVYVENLKYVHSISIYAFLLQSELTSVKYYWLWDTTLLKHDDNSQPFLKEAAFVQLKFPGIV